jgi:hypothetical protein
MVNAKGPQNQASLRKFNQLVGNRVGRPVRPGPGKGSTDEAIAKRRKQRQAGAGQKAISTWVSHGGGKVPASTRKANEAWFGTGSATEVSDPYTGANKAFNQIYDNLSQQLDNQTRDQKAVRTAYAANVLDKQVNPDQPEFEHGVHVGPSIDEQYLGGNVQRYAVGTAAKAGAVVPNVLAALAKGGYDARDQGEGYWGQTVAGLKEAGGAWNKSWEDTLSPYVDLAKLDPSNTSKRIAGPAHGEGDVYEIIKNRGHTPVSGGLRTLEKHAPWAEQAIADTAGAAGDYYLHPVGRMIGGGKAGVIGGETATESSVSNYVREQADKWANDAEDQIVTGAAKAPGGYRVYPSVSAMSDHFYDSVMDRLKTAQLSVNAGGSKGRYEILNPKMTAGIIGAHGANALQESLTSLFSDRVQRLVDGMEGRGQKLTGGALHHWSTLNPDFTEFLDDIQSHLINEGHIPPNSSLNEVANYLNGADTKMVREIEQGVVDRHYTPYVQQAANDIARESRNNYYNAPALRVGNKMHPVKALGHAYSSLSNKFIDDVGKNFRYNSIFPGSLSLDTTRARAWGVRATEDFEKLVREKAKPFAKEDGIEIQHAIENGTVHLLDPEKQAVAIWIKDQYKTMYMDEFNSGARGRFQGRTGSTTPYDPNYAYVHNKGGTITDRGNYKHNRKETIHENVRAGNGQGAGRFKTPNAKEAGLRPTENAFEALRLRRIKHNRDMIRTNFRNDMIDKYGIVSRINPSGKGYAAEARGLVQVDFHNLPEHMRANFEKTGEGAYLPKEMARMINQFDEITKWHSGVQGRIGRSFAEVMRVIKKGMTLPWPGFHNKNMIGDVFMGLLDHVLPKDYAAVMQKGLASMGGKDAIFKIIPGHSISFRDFWKKFQSEANSGFMGSELGTLDSTSARFNLPKRVAGKAEDIAVGVSGFREEAGRFTHYVTAYKQEAQALWKSGEKDLAKIEQKASSAALWRVNNYKFDYNALTLWEKQAKTLYFPFFTFFRKAAPTLMQALYQDPRWISSWTRYMYQRSTPNGQESADSFDGFRVPSDIRDAGYAFIGGQKDQPNYVTNDILPTSVFNQIKTDSVHNFANSILSQVALPYQVAIEQGTGQQTFLDRPLQDQSTGDYLASKLPGVREFGQIFDSKKPLGERLISSRLGAGLPIHRLTEAQQLFAENEWQDKLIDNPIQAVNTQQDLFYISRQPSPNKQSEIFTVKSKTLLDAQGNATDVASFYTPQEAAAYVKKHLPDGYKKIPKTWDMDNQGNPIQRPVGG